jgi:single-strand DNA-binding protein
MFNAPQISFVGNLVDDPELRFTPSGAAVANMRFAITPRIKKNDEYIDGETVWLSGSVWRDMAENVAETLQKGSRVIVRGSLTCRSYETREGDKRVSWEVEIDDIGPDLRHATAKISKVSRAGGAQGGQNAAQGASAPPPNPFAQPQQSQPPSVQQGPPSAPPQQPPQQPPAQQPPAYKVGDIANGWQLQADGSWKPAAQQAQTSTNANPTNPTGQAPVAQSDPWQTPPAQQPQVDEPPF